MSVVAVRKIRKPRVAPRAKNIGNEVFREIVKMAYEMDKAEEQKKATKVFRSLMRFITECQIDTDYKQNPIVIADDIFYDGGYNGFSLTNEEIHSLFLYFVWKNGLKQVHQKAGHSLPRPADDHLIYFYKGNYWCEFEACSGAVARYILSPARWN